VGKEEKNSMKVSEMIDWKIWGKSNGEEGQKKNDVYVTSEVMGGSMSKSLTEASPWAWDERHQQQQHDPVHRARE
jgi:hypothetical protein